MSLTTIRVSEADFNPGEEIERLIESSPEAGGVASFVGVVRNRNDGNDVTHLTLEHYPAMTERALAGIVERARARWDVCGVTVIHRVGEMAVGEHIVLVVVTSAHRREQMYPKQETQGIRFFPKTTPCSILRRESTLRLKQTSRRSHSMA